MQSHQLCSSISSPSCNAAVDNVPGPGFALLSGSIKPFAALEVQQEGTFPNKLTSKGRTVERGMETDKWTRTYKLLRLRRLHGLAGEGSRLHRRMTLNRLALLGGSCSLLLLCRLLLRLLVRMVQARHTYISRRHQSTTTHACSRHLQFAQPCFFTARAQQQPLQ